MQRHRVQAWACVQVIFLTQEPSLEDLSWTETA